MTRYMGLPAAGLAALLSACSSGGSDTGTSNGLCRAIADNGATVDAMATPGGSFENPEAAFDGSFSTAATLTSPGGSGQSTIRGTLGSGSESADTIAGMFFRGQINATVQVSVTTYLDGVQQESGTATYQRDPSNTDTAFWGRVTSLDYDAIEISFSLSNTPTVEIFEICVRDNF